MYQVTEFFPRLHLQGTGHRRSALGTEETTLYKHEVSVP